MQNKRDSDRLTNKFDEYNSLYKKIDTIPDLANQRAVACDRIKTEEEIEREEAERIQRLEREKKERMKGNYEEDKPKVATKSVDSLSGG